MTFASPWHLLLLFAVPLLFWRRAGESSAPRLLFPAAALAAVVRPSLRRRLVVLQPLLRALAFTVIVLCLARPQQGSDQAIVSARGIDIQLLLDISSSMTRTDLAAATRLDVAVSVIDRFIESRPEDRIGLITFARYPRLVSPLTLDHDALREFLRGVESVAGRSEEDSTGIGVALAAAALRLREDARRTRIVVLLTDGEEREHAIAPQDAADLARAHGIKVYAVAVATHSGVFADELRALAESTGGRGFVASDARSLSAIYERIDLLEKQEIAEARLTEWSDLYPWILWLAALLLLAELPLDLFYLRRAP